MMIRKYNYVICSGAASAEREAGEGQGDGQVQGILLCRIRGQRILKGTYQVLLADPDPFIFPDPEQRKASS